MQLLANEFGGHRLGGERPGGDRAGRGPEESRLGRPALLWLLSRRGLRLAEDPGRSEERHDAPSPRPRHPGGAVRLPARRTAAPRRGGAVRGRRHRGGSRRARALWLLGAGLR
ncbi:hypothetical protein KCH_12890 [Kitasatospora cheerisanensis KCTC 2395]|uniref:Uncharacterized protein n=1 Tax=Kitasatospora cheerisanensis KCTC 2395 TaxID=1348663 RepID=A0A066YZ71_9ACTN|nr:hypothetical protein KCH_12890 [Kitasatospora cheerisanensis KCTC 2395]